MPIKLYGYSSAAASAHESGPLELAEVTLVASPKDLRQISEFLTAAASEMERMGNTYSHEHLSDKHPCYEGSPQFVVMSPEAAS